MGISVKKKVLLPEAVPAIHMEPVSGKLTCQKTSPSPSLSPDKTLKKATSVSQSKSKHSFFSASPPKKMRSAYRKRESRRVCPIYVPNYN
ncbi:hypothetical protein FSP39_009186 [Pinctada imbricata]|uniref:Uncharacterized protein n=1 Tax=Pinctada imbricata TaxID=66713 RepID=A0AA88YV46_PINIB|nr:hypothetical protein FSP39_009186 [Pinctada imbricata]